MLLLSSSALKLNCVTFTSTVCFELRIKACKDLKVKNELP